MPPPAAILRYFQGKLVSEPHYQGTDELLTVSKGRLRVRAGGKETVLKSGDTVQYAADTPHAIWNLSRFTTKAYLIVWYRP